MSKTIVVGCKLPNGIALEGSKGQRVELNGINTALVASPDAFGATRVDEAEWSYLSLVYAELQPFKSNAVFSFGTDAVADALAMAGELAGEKTGLEALDPSKPGKDLKPSEDAPAPKAVQNAVTAKAVTGAANKAAALEVAQAKG